MPIRGKPGANPVQPPLPYFGQPISRNTRRLQSVLFFLFGKEKYRPYKKPFCRLAKGLFLRRVLTVHLKKVSGFSAY